MLTEQGIELMVKAERMNGSVLRMAMQQYLLNRRVGSRARSPAQGNDIRHGEQTVEDLNRQNRPLKHMDLEKKTDPDLAVIRREFNRYGVDFSIVEEKEEGVFRVFFKAQDADRIEMAMDKVNDAFSRPPMDEQLKDAVAEAEDRNAAHNLEKTMEQEVKKAAEKVAEVSL